MGETFHPGGEANAPVWRRPHALGYAEALRSFGGVVAPLLAGFSLAAIATVVTADDSPPLGDWAVGAFGVAVALLLYSMQVASLGLTRNSTPDEVLMWRPEATVSEDELQAARVTQAADLKEVQQLGALAFRTYGWGIVAFLTGVLLLIIPEGWSAGRIIGSCAIGAALVVEVWWLTANRYPRLRHPAGRLRASHKAGWGSDHPRELSSLGYSAVMVRTRNDLAPVEDSDD